MARQPDNAAVQLIQQDSEQAEVAPAPLAQENKEQVELQRTFFLSECEFLHDEINTRMGQRGNLFTFTIITAGSLLSLGATTNAQIALFYPILSLFLAAAWSDEDGKIGALGAYLHDQEARYDLYGWTSYHRPRHKPSSFFPANVLNLLPSSLLSVATRGVFLSTQLLAILVGVVNANQHKDLGDISVWPLLVIAIIAMVITAFVIRHKRNHTLERETRNP
jgi:hypothetical protein